MSTVAPAKEPMLQPGEPVRGRAGPFWTKCAIPDCRHCASLAERHRFIGPAETLAA